MSDTAPTPATTATQQNVPNCDETTAKQVQEVVRRVQQVLVSLKLTQQHVVRETGLEMRDLVAWARLKYSGDYSVISKKLIDWSDRTVALHVQKRRLEQQKQREQRAAQLRAAEQARKAAVVQATTGVPVTNALPTRQPLIIDDIVPIRLKVQVGSKKFRDEFLWDTKNQRLSIQACARTIVEENSLSQGFVNAISKSLTRQLDEMKFIRNIPYEKVKLDKEKGWLKICLTLENKKIAYNDTILWDPYALTPTPEDFATQLCSDLGITMDWSNIIAFEIRYQIVEHFRSLTLGITNPSIERYNPKSHFCSEPIESLLSLIEDDELVQR